MRLTAKDAELVLAPELGGTITSWTIGGRHMLRTGSTDPGARGQAAYPLVPFSNRIAGAQFSFDGAHHLLPILLQPWSIHGAGWQCAWEAPAPGVMVLDFPAGPLWPFAFRAEQHFTLGARDLHVRMRITNTHTGPAPAGLGLHPFFPRDADTVLQFQARGVWRNGGDMIPTDCTEVPPEWDFAEPRRMADLAVDNCFAGWHGAAALTYPATADRLVITASMPFRHLVVYVPKDGWFCAVEPVSHMNDAIHHMTEAAENRMAVLAPGETLQGDITLRLESLNEHL